MWLYAEVRTIADIPRYYGRTAPDSTALVDSLGKLTFKELDLVTNRIANALIHDGMAPGARVGYIGKNAPRYFEAIMGVNKAGGILVALNWRLSPVELDMVVSDAGCSVVFVDREFIPLIEAVQQRRPHAFGMVVFDSATTEPAPFDAWIASVADTDPGVAVDPLDPALLFYTSGTTGKPKGVMLSHQGLSHMRLCEHLEPALQWKPDDVMLMVMPNFHLVGGGLSLQALYNGSPVSTLPMLEPARLIEVIARDRPTICALVPTAIQMVLDHPAARGADFSSLRLVMYAGSPISARLLQRAIKDMGCAFMQFYGATESSGALTLLRPEQHDINNETRLKSCGTPLPLIDVRIMDANGEEVPEGQIGEFWARTPSMFAGYWNQPAATAEVMRDGWYRTGDAGFRDPEGLLYIVDRVKDMIVTGGENVYSGEVEQALQKHPAVCMAAVIGAPDERWGERVTAVVIRAEGVEVTEQDLMLHCRSLLAGYKVPKSVHFVEALPMTPTGKVLKRAVRDQFWNGAERPIG